MKDPWTRRYVLAVIVACIVVALEGHANSYPIPNGAPFAPDHTPSFTTTL